LAATTPEKRLGSVTPGSSPATTSKGSFVSTVCRRTDRRARSSHRASGPGLTVTAVDSYGNVATGYTGRVHFKSSDRYASLPRDYSFTAADQGVRTFTGLILRRRGTQTISVTDTLTSALTGSLTVEVV
jgi:hypothetical protein